MSKNKLSAVWNKEDDRYYPVGNIVKTIPVSGIYTVDTDNNGRLFFGEKRLIVDELYELQSSLAEKIIKDIGKFWGKKSVYAKFKLVWKRGILLHGRPGIGKTSITNLVINFFLREGGIVLFSRYTRILQSGLEELRKRNPDVPVLVIFEDIENYIERDDEGLLALLDGDIQSENIIYIATTNYVESLPQRIVNRPGRFDVICEALPPTAEVRRAYFNIKFTDLDIANTLLEQIVVDTEGFSFSQLKEFIINIFCLDVEYVEALEKVRKFTYVDDNDDTQYCEATCEPSKVSDAPNPKPCGVNGQ